MFSPGPNQSWAVSTYLDVEASSSASGSLVGEMTVDSTIDPTQAILTGQNFRTTAGQQWKVSGLPAGTHTIKISARVTSGTGWTYRPPHSTLLVVRSRP